MRKAISVLTAGLLAGFAFYAPAGNDALRIKKVENESKTISTVEIEDDAVTSDKIATDAVTADGIAAGAVGTSEIADGSVAGADLNNGSDMAATNGTVSTVESAAILKHTRISLTNVVLTATDGSDEGESQELGGPFPEGPITFLSVTADLICVTPTGATNVFVMAVGTAAAADDATLTSTEANIVPSTSIDTTDGTVTTNACQAILASPVTIDGTATPATLYLNMAIVDSDMDDAVTNTVTGDIEAYYLVGTDK